MKETFKSNYPDVVRIVRLTKYEMGSLAANWGGRFSSKQRALVNRLQGEKALKVNVASGRATKAGWINLDVSPAADIRMDLRRPLPFAGCSVSLIFNEHFCDHLNFPSATQRFLAECHRVLEPGGRARFVLHDAEGLLRAYLDRDTRYFEVGDAVVAGAPEQKTMMASVNHLFRFNDMHQFLFDFETFELVLRKAGFQSVKRCKYLQSEMPEVVLDYALPDREMLSMYVEAVK